ncbi:hypothetical protein [uncultured Mucilaginibacter sp.]|uniref:hypothetical protein n=1 Tax=uncultured Mucilaginibacter sp. TaxID=797541 RepID=UPI0025E9FECD|nr:hypothetical protein [uncultured Mucilaginibacter sp.]
MRNGLFEYGDQVVINETDEKGTVNINQTEEGSMVEVELQSGEVRMFSEDELAFDEDYAPQPPADDTL